MTDAIHQSATPVSKGPRIQIIDLLRFGAAACVVFYHWCFRGVVDHRVTVIYDELTGQARYLH